MATESQDKKASQAGNDQEGPAKSRARKGKALRISAKAARFRRAGITFGREPTVVMLSDLEKDQVEQLRAEPMLTVEDIEV